MNPLFGSGFVDEIRLKEECTELLDTLQGVLTPQKLLQISQEYGIDKATVLLYEWLVQYRHREFNRHLSNLPTSIDDAPSDSKILIVPGMFHKEYPEMGGDGCIIQSIVQRFGFDAEIVPTHSTGDLQTNAGILQAAIKRQQGRPLWLISISKGSADSGLCLNQLQTHDKKSLRGWISLCGIFKGSPMADIRLNNPVNRLILKSYLKLKGANANAIEEMRCSNPLWQRNLDDCAIDLIHVQPIPIAAYVHAKLIKRYRQLSSLGPNDGTILLSDLIYRRGDIYPLWGVDHFFRDRAVVPLIYKLCRLIKSRDKQRKNNDEHIENTRRSGTHVTAMSV